MRILFVTDIHIGAAADGFQMQPRWVDAIPYLLDQFVQRARELQPDLIVIGGDSIEQGVPEQIEPAAAFMERLPGRTLVCLGNHDLTQPGSADLWRQRLSRSPRVTLADAMLQTPECDIIALNVNWLSENGRPLLQWTAGQYPQAAAGESQLAQLDQWLRQNGDRPAVLALHAQLNGVPPEKCGMPNAFEPPRAEFEQSLRRVIDAHPRLRLTLSGHCHAACAVRRGSRVELTGTSYTETPHQFQVIDVEAGRLNVRTESLLRPGSPAVVVDRLWVCGQPGDQSLQV